MATDEVCATHLTIWTCTTSQLVTAAVSQAALAGSDPLVVQRRRTPTWQREPFQKRYSGGSSPLVGSAQVAQRQRH